MKNKRKGEGRRMMTEVGRGRCRKSEVGCQKSEIGNQKGKMSEVRSRMSEIGSQMSEIRCCWGNNTMKKDNLITLRSREVTSKLEILKEKIIKILKKNKVTKAGIFGSYARGDEKKNSDIDILIQYPKGLGFGFAGIELELEDVLKKKVDLLTYGAVHPLLKERILNEEVRII